MQALIAESGVVTRVTLRRILERHGFSVEELRDELAAACLLYQPEAPEIALLALDTLLVDFAQVCEAMRAAKQNVYIIALIPEARRHEVAGVLDAGADDFLIKPVVIQEAETRIRIIRRTLAALGGPPAAVMAAGEQWAEAPGAARLHLFDNQKLAEAFADVFSQMDLGPVRAAPADCPLPPSAYAVWVPVLVRQSDQAYWLNLRIDLGEENAERLFRKVMPKASCTEEALLAMLQELMGLAQDGIRTVACAQKETEVFTPAAPLAREAGRIPSPVALASAYARRHTCAFSLADDLYVELTLTVEPTPLKERGITRLVPMDVLAAHIQAAEYDTLLLRAGTLLNDTYIDKIQAFVHAQNLSQRVNVYHPPAGTATFLYDHVFS